MNFMNDLSFRAPYLIMDEKGLLNVVLNQKYTSELQRKERAYDYSYVSLKEGSLLNTIGFTDVGIMTLVKDFNARKFTSDERLHAFNFHLQSNDFTAKPEELAITPYIDTSHASDDTLSNFSSQMIEFIK